MLFLFLSLPSLSYGDCSNVNAARQNSAVELSDVSMVEYYTIMEWKGTSLRLLYLGCCYMPWKRQPTSMDYMTPVQQIRALMPDRIYCPFRSVLGKYTITDFTPNPILVTVDRLGDSTLFLSIYKSSSIPVSCVPLYSRPSCPWVHHTMSDAKTATEAQASALEQERTSK